MSSLYARPSSASSASGVPPPRFEHGSTVIRRPAGTVSIALRTQPQAYPHMHLAAESVSTHASVQVVPTPSPRSIRPPPSPSFSSSSRAASRPQSALTPRSLPTRPLIHDADVRDRYLPRAYSATTPILAATWSHQVFQPSTGTGTEDEESSQMIPSQIIISNPPQPYPPVHPSHALANEPTFHPALNHNYSHIQPKIPRADGSVPESTLRSSRGFMSTKPWMAFVEKQEAEEREEMRLKEEALHHARSKKRRTPQQNVPDTFQPTIPFPARIAHSIPHPSSSSSPHPPLNPSSHSNSQHVTTKSSSDSTIRLPTTLGLHDRSLDVMQVLADLKSELDLNFEIVRIEDNARRVREEIEEQNRIRIEAERMNQSLQLQKQQQQQSPLQYIQSGKLSIPITSNVTATTLALLAHTPTHSSKSLSSSFLHPSPPPPPISSYYPPTPQPTFLTDQQMESHALSNLTEKQRKKMFGGAYAKRDSDDEQEAEEQQQQRSMQQSEEEESKSNFSTTAATPLIPKHLPKETPFDRTRQDDPTHDGPQKPRPPRVGARRPQPTNELPNVVEYTPEMIEAFETSLAHWTEFILTSNNMQSDLIARNDPHAHSYKDLVLMLLDLSKKYSTLIRLAMNPTSTTHHTLPRMMESVWKVMMVTLETVLVRKSRNQVPPEQQNVPVMAPSTPTASAAAQTAQTDAAAIDPSTIPEEKDASADSSVQSPTPSPSTSSKLTSPRGSTSQHMTFTTPPSMFDPTNPAHLQLFQTSLSSYDKSLALTQPPTSNSLAAANDILTSLSVQNKEKSLHENGLYSVGLLLQRDSLLKASERLLRENEFLKLNLREAHHQIKWLKDNQEIEIRALAETGEDIVGIALDELDDYMEECIDGRKAQLDTLLKVTEMGYEWTQKHASSLVAEATAESTHKESMDTIRRVNAKEGDLLTARKIELEARQALESANLMEKSKAFAILDREVASVEVLTDEQIVAKVSGISDVDTLRGMIHKLLFTKVKRHINETPAQKAARLRKENTPKILKQVMLHAKNTERLMGLKMVCRTVLEIYFAKILSDDSELRELAVTSTLTQEMISRRRGHSIHGFVYEYFLQKYGLKMMAENNLAELMRSVMVFLNPDRSVYSKYSNFISLNTDALMDKNSKMRLGFFSRMLHLFTDHPLPVEGMEFFLFALKILQESCVQSIPASFNTAHPKDSSIDSSKYMIRTMELASVNINFNSGLSARATGKRNAAMDPSLVALVRSTSPTRGSNSVTEDAESGQLSLYIPLFLAIESMAHSFRQLGYTDEVMDATLCTIETHYICPANVKTAGTDLSKQRLLLKQIIVRQMIRTAGVGTNLAFDKFDTDKSGVITFEKLREQINMDEETAYQLASMMDGETGFLGNTAGITLSDFTQALAPEFRLCVSLDVLLEVSTLAWLKEHQSLSERYRAAFLKSDPSNHGLLNFIEFYLMIQSLDTLKTRTIAAKIFKEGTEMERRVVEAAAAEEEAKEAKKLAAGKNGSSKKKKKKSKIIAIPPPPITGIGANLPEGMKIEIIDENNTITPSSAAAAPIVPPVAPTSPSNLSRKRSVKFGTTDSSSEESKATSDSKDGKKSSATDTKSALTKQPSLVRQVSIKDNEFISLTTCITLLRRHRIGLPPRKPFQEFKAFFRRYKPIQPKKEEIKNQITQPILASQPITSIPDAISWLQQQRSVHLNRLPTCALCKCGMRSEELISLQDWEPIKKMKEFIERIEREEKQANNIKQIKQTQEEEEQRRHRQGKESIKGEFDNESPQPNHATTAATTSSSTPSSFASHSIHYSPSSLLCSNPLLFRLKLSSLQDRLLAQQARLNHDQPIFQKTLEQFTKKSDQYKEMKENYNDMAKKLEDMKQQLEIAREMQDKKKKKFDSLQRAHTILSKHEICWSIIQRAKAHENDIVKKAIQTAATSSSSTDSLPSVSLSNAFHSSHAFDPEQEFDEVLPIGQRGGDKSSMHEKTSFSRLHLLRVAHSFYTARHHQLRSEKSALEKVFDLQKYQLEDRVSELKTLAHRHQKKYEEKKEEKERLRIQKEVMEADQRIVRQRDASNKIKQSSSSAASPTSASYKPVLHDVTTNIVNKSSASATTAAPAPLRPISAPIRSPSTFALFTKQPFITTPALILKKPPSSASAAATTVASQSTTPASASKKRKQVSPSASSSSNVNNKLTTSKAMANAANTKKSSTTAPLSFFASQFTPSQQAHTTLSQNNHDDDDSLPSVPSPLILPTHHIQPLNYKQLAQSEEEREAEAILNEFWQ